MDHREALPVPEKVTNSHVWNMVNHISVQEFTFHECLYIVIWNILLPEFSFQTVLTWMWKQWVDFFLWWAEFAEVPVRLIDFLKKYIFPSLTLFSLAFQTVSKYTREENWHKCTQIQKDSDKSVFQLLRTFISRAMRIKIKLKYKI